MNNITKRLQQLMKLNNIFQAFLFLSIPQNNKFLILVEKDFPEQKSAIPNRKKRNQEFSQEEKEYNKIHSKKRIVIEHIICRLKKYRIQSDIFRNKLRKYDRISDIVAGLVNYRIMNQHL
jgi:hypothetical protein